MKIQISKASAENKQVISNLMQLYMYDFSEYTGSDVEADGLFAAYPTSKIIGEKRITGSPILSGMMKYILVLFLRDVMKLRKRVIFP
jgi:hypothetical protein